MTNLVSCRESELNPNWPSYVIYIYCFDDELVYTHVHQVYTYIM